VVFVLEVLAAACSWDIVIVKVKNLKEKNKKLVS
jgi:hypothetical protein